MNLVDLPVKKGHVTLFDQRLPVPRGAPDGQAITLGLRPQEIRTLEAGGGGVPARIIGLERHGSTTLCSLSHPSGQTLLVGVPGDVDYAVLAEIHIDLASTPSHCFAPDGRRIGA